MRRRFSLSRMTTTTWPSLSRPSPEDSLETTFRAYFVQVFRYWFSNPNSDAINACRLIYEKSIRIWTGLKYISCSCESALITWLSSVVRSRVPWIFLYGAYQHLPGNPGRAAFQVPSSLRIWCRGILACPRRCPVMSRYFSKDQNWQSALAYFLLTTKMGEGRVIRSLTPPPRTPAFLNDDDTFNQKLI